MWWRRKSDGKRKTQITSADYSTTVSRCPPIGDSLWHSTTVVGARRNPKNLEVETPRTCFIVHINPAHAAAAALPPTTDWVRFPDQLSDCKLHITRVSSANAISTAAGLSSSQESPVALTQLRCSRPVACVLNRITFSSIQGYSGYFVHQERDYYSACSAFGAGNGVGSVRVRLHRRAGSWSHCFLPICRFYSVEPTGRTYIRLVLITLEPASSHLK